MLAVVFSLDQFPLGLLGCYGNSTVQTPCLDHIAAASVVFDLYFGEDFSPNPIGHAWWSGCHHFPRAGTEAVSRMPVLTAVLGEAGIEARWITDAEDTPLIPVPAGATTTVEASFDEVLQTGCEQLEAWSSQPDQRKLLWLKVGRSAWDFSEFTELDWTEEEASLLPAVLEAADRSDWSPEHWDLHRQLLELAVERLDETLVPLWERIKSLGKQRSVLFVFTAAQGILLGRRANLPPRKTSWVEDCVHLPLLAFQSGSPGGERYSEFVSPLDLSATLLDFLACPAPVVSEGRSILPVFSGETVSRREILTLGSSRSWGAVRTQDFYFVRWDGEESEEPRRLLFLKPEDVWDWHDVASQEPEMTETLSTELDRFMVSARYQLPMPESAVENSAEICGETKSG